MLFGEECHSRQLPGQNGSSALEPASSATPSPALSLPVSKAALFPSVLVNIASQ